MDSADISNYLPLLRTYLSELAAAASAGPILDLACGSGRNGLYLLENHIPVVFADIKAEALSKIQQRLETNAPGESKQLASVWEVDLELSGTDPFGQRKFGGIMVYNYLHRPLLARLRQAVHSGGMVIYQTFTIDQVKYGRPNNPDFLLMPGELREHFSDWDVLHYYEGVMETDSGTGSKAIAQLAARKPASR